MAKYNLMFIASILIIYVKTTYNINESLLFNKNIIFQKPESYNGFICQKLGSVKQLDQAKILEIKPDYNIFQRHDLSFLDCNPSIIKIEDNFLVSLRVLSNNRNRINIDNILIFYDKNLKKISEYLIKELKSPDFIGRFEDMRLFYLNNNIHFCGTAIFYEASPYSGDFQKMCIGKLEKREDAFYLTEFNLFKNQNPNRYEKNWLPFTINDNLYFIYGYNPFAIIKVDLQDYTYKLFFEEDYGSKLEGFRGSTPPIEFDDGYLFIIHEACNSIYTHRFIYMNKDFKIKKISDPFYFKQLFMEFCCGLTSSIKGNKIIISFGISYNSSFLCKLKKNYVNSLLKEI